MKRCPTCQRTFSDDISFCLMDGTPLQAEFDQEQSTLVRPPKVSQPSETASRRFPVIGCSIVALLAVIAVGVITGVIILVRNSSMGNANQTNTANQSSNANGVNKDVANRQPANQQQQIDTNKQKEPVSNQVNLNDQRTKPPVNSATPMAADPPTTRITFHRGSVQETLAGSVIKKRVYVLRTLSGQFLYATLSSTGGCVLFSNGSTGVSYQTNSGDMQLEIVNKCPSPASYKLTVSVQ